MKSINQTPIQESLGERLRSFVTEFSASGNTMIHLVALYSLETDRCFEFLQETFDQYERPNMKKLFTKAQQDELEFLVREFGIKRSPFYELSAQRWDELLASKLN